MTTYKNGFFSEEDLVDILNQIRAINKDFKERKHDLSRDDAVSFRIDLAVLREQLGDIMGDLFEDKIETEAAYENFLLMRTDELVKSFIEQEKETGKKVTYPEDRAKRQAKIEGFPLQSEMNKAKVIYTKAYIFVQHTLGDVLNAMSSKIGLSSPSVQATPDQTRPVYDDPYTKYFGAKHDAELDRAIQQTDELKDAL